MKTSNMRHRRLEVCCADAESVIAAINGGADRIELCCALSEGGVTPSEGLIKFAVKRSPIPVNVLIRPRGGDFVYLPEEIDVMVSDIHTAGRLGANGVVIGSLTESGDIDIEQCGRMIDAAHSHNLSVTFHRAFDLCRDPYSSLESIIFLGADRLLTSGQAPTALEGARLIAELVSSAAGRLIIMPGAGINAGNVAELIAKTNASEVHASASRIVNSRMSYRNPAVSMGGDPATDDYSRKTTSAVKVKELVTILHNMNIK